MKTALIVLVKNFELGKVKTRLAKDVGDVKALDIYRQLVEYTYSICTALNVPKYVFYSDYIPSSSLWDGFNLKTQTEGGLGEKLKNALLNVPEDKVILIGSDCAELNKDILMEAVSKLNNNDVVLGPAKDGGYYLIGLSKNYSFLLDNKSWSTDKLYKETIEQIAKKELSYFELPVLSDVDYITDLQNIDWIKI